MGCTPPRFSWNQPRWQCSAMRPTADKGRPRRSGVGYAREDSGKLDCDVTDGHAAKAAKTIGSFADFHWIAWCRNVVTDHNIHPHWMAFRPCDQPREVNWRRRGYLISLDSKIWSARFLSRSGQRNRRDQKPRPLFRASQAARCCARCFSIRSCDSLVLTIPCLRIALAIAQ